jgi:K+-sensing histidine kinase KdpD
MEKSLSYAELQTLVELGEIASRSGNVDDFAAAMLPVLLREFSARSVLLFCGGPGLAEPLFFSAGLPVEQVAPVKTWCSQQIEQAHIEEQAPASVVLSAPAGPAIRFFPIIATKKRAGFLGLSADAADQSPGFMDRFLHLVSQSISNFLNRASLEKQLHRLNTYMNVSSLIAQALDLRDVLEAVLYFGMEALSAEAASVLLLDYEKNTFRFYSVEGPAKAILLTAAFPADQGLAGSVLRSGQSEVVNDVQSDPRFYNTTDAQSGFVTRNVVAIPLIAGEEKIGVLEILNRTDGAPFTEDDRLLIQPIAEEVAFAIRNAKLFEVVVKSYCKQRQGLNTCEGCKRPLGSWTPCVRYREESGL